MNNLTLKNIFKRKIFKFLIYVFLLLFLSLWILEILSNFWMLYSLQSFFDNILSILTYSVSLSDTISVSFFSLVSFAFLIFIGLNLAKLYKKFIYKIKRKRKNLSHWTISILSNLGYYSIITIFILTSLKIIGIDLSSFTMIISALSVWIWFWLQTIVSNFISGIILMFEQSVKEGDFIELWEELRWTVTSINMRSTTIRTNSNIDIVVPNQNFIENNIVNWTHNDNKVKLYIPFSVAYWTTFEKVQTSILTDLKNSELNYLNDENFEPSVFMVWMWNSSVDFKLAVWVQWDETNVPLIAKWKFLRLIYESLNNNNISIPFPQTDLHIKDSVPLNINLNKK